MSCSRALIGSLDLAAPAAGLSSSPLEKLLEALEVSLHPAVGSAEGGPDLLLDSLGDEVHLDHHPGVVVVEPVEGDHAGVVLAVGVPPRHTLLGPLLGDLGVPFVTGPAELCDTVKVHVVTLRDFLDALHELRELLELSPLVVHRRERCLDLDGLLNSRHLSQIPGRWCR